MDAYLQPTPHPEVHQQRDCRGKKRPARIPGPIFGIASFHHGGTSHGAKNMGCFRFGLQFRSASSKPSKKGAAWDDGRRGPPVRKRAEDTLRGSSSAAIVSSRSA